MEPNTVTLQIQSEGHMARLLAFLHDTQISFQIENPSNFQRTLYQLIDEDKVNPSWLRSSVLEEQLNSIEGELEQGIGEDEESYSSYTMFKEFRNLVNKEYNSDSMRVLYKPTEHFKEFCGGEWLTRDGLISANTVLTFLEHNIKNRGIRMVNGVIYTTDWLRTVLQDTRDTIFYDELPILVNTLLKK
jgi:hypothetical protein